MEINRNTVIKQHITTHLLFKTGAQLWGNDALKCVKLWDSGIIVLTGGLAWFRQG